MLKWHVIKNLPTTLTLHDAESDPWELETFKEYRPESSRLLFLLMNTMKSAVTSWVILSSGTISFWFLKRKKN